MRSSSAETIAFIDSPGGYGRWKAVLFSAPDGVSARWNPLCCRVSGVYHRETSTLRSVDRSSRCLDRALPVVEVLRGLQELDATKHCTAKGARPYAVLELVLPGGSLIVIPLWLHRRGQGGRCQPLDP